MSDLCAILRGIVFVLLGRCERCGCSETCIDYHVTRDDGTTIRSLRLCARCSTDMFDPAGGWTWTPVGEGW